MRILALDVGFGTTDILIYDSRLAIANCPKLVIPSQTQQVAARIRAATERRLPVAMPGVTMGGGPSGAALKAHLQTDLPFYASPEAARTFSDDLDKVASWGVEIAADPVAAAPEGSVVVPSGDVDLAALLPALEQLGLDGSFDGAAIAVQDHGFSPQASNRVYRFKLWHELLERDARLASLAYRAEAIPSPYTRMSAAAGLLTQLGPVVAMDTGPAALWGALLDRPERSPRLVANLGNGHTLAAIIAEGRLMALVEHHTRLLDQERFTGMIKRFCAGKLSNEDVFNDGGHGCLPPTAPVELHDLEPLLVTGPQREKIRAGGLKLSFAAPYGDMMLTGCFGLVEAWRSLTSNPSA